MLLSGTQYPLSLHSFDNGYRIKAKSSTESVWLLSVAPQAPLLIGTCMTTTQLLLPFTEYQGIARILHHLLFHYPTQQRVYELIEHDVAASWPTLGDRSGNRLGREALSHFLQQWDQHQLVELQLDYGQLFFGPGEPKAIPQGSVYLGEEQLLNDRSTVQLMDFYRQHGVALTLAQVQPVDHIGLFFTVLDAAFGHLAQQPDDTAQYHFVQQLLAQHLLPWAGRCLELAAEHAQTEFYFAIALLADDFLQQLALDFAVQPVAMRLHR